MRASCSATCRRHISRIVSPALICVGPRSTIAYASRWDLLQEFTDRRIARAWIRSLRLAKDFEPQRIRQVPRARFRFHRPERFDYRAGLRPAQLFLRCMQCIAIDRGCLISVVNRTLMHSAGAVHRPFVTNDLWYIGRLGPRKDGRVWTAYQYRRHYFLPYVTTITISADHPIVAPFTLPRPPADDVGLLRRRGVQQ
jgi:hypothetical protein